jgi:hypothetical protein
MQFFLKVRFVLDLTPILLKCDMLIENFIRAVRLFRNKPAMLRQAMRDAELYVESGQLTNADLIMLRRLAYA